MYVAKYKSGRESGTIQNHAKGLAYHYTDTVGISDEGNNDVYEGDRSD